MEDFETLVRRIIQFMLLVPAVLVCLACYEQRSVTRSELHLDDLWTASGYRLDDKIRGRIYINLEKVEKLGFMQVYREMYFKLYAKEAQPFAEKLEAASVILIASHNLVTESHFRSSGKRLFLHFCRSFFLDSDFAMKMNRLNKRHRLFYEDRFLENSWNAYLKEIWGKVHKPEIQKKQKIEKLTQAFLTEFPEFSTEAKKLIESSLPDSESEERYEYILKEGKTGENEEDFKLKKVQ
jgi:hypothetical protein